MPGEYQHSSFENRGTTDGPQGTTWRFLKKKTHRFHFSNLWRIIILKETSCVVPSEVIVQQTVRFVGAPVFTQRVRILACTIGDQK
jgi:hypothetical protein